MGAQKCPRRRFFCQQYEMTFRQLRNSGFSPNLAMTGESCLKRRLWKKIFKKVSIQGLFAPKPQTWRGSNRHLTQRGLQVNECIAERYCLLRVIIQGPGSFRVLVNIFVRRTVAELPNFRIFTYFHHTKRLKSTFRWPAYSPGVTSQNDFDFSMW